jgi:cytochrome c oxidase cbb3-type subunit I/II
LEWPIDILITIIWVVFGINMFGTIIKRREKHLYVGIWFYIATFVTIAMLHIVNSLEIPVSLTKSYSLYAGVQDALVQWWYGHNAVAFFLTTPYLGVMYYFLPKAANRPVYSYKLSIVHFWGLIFLYIWAGPHHLLYSSLPEWAQSLGTAFSIMLLAPSWGGMFNGLLTLRGAWDKVREDAILKFLVVAITAYGMSTFEGPLLSLKNVNAISHFTDWTVAHVHVGALGWNGFMTFAMLYWLMPRLFNTEIYSKKLMNTHFWLGTLGILLYAIPMYWAGFSQSLSWSEFTADGTLRYTFMDTVVRIKLLYLLRGIGGTIYLTGFIVMLYNLIKTIKKGSLVAEEAASAPALSNATSAHAGEHWHRWLERRPIQFLVVSLVVVAIGGIVEFVPTFMIKSNVPTIASVKPYTPLELEGRDVYIKEGCYNCHSQMIRPFRHETERYGEYSKAGEFVYDHPFQWGSKRTGPDLAREGGRNPDSWHFKHMYEPSWITTGSIMPSYPWLFHEDIDESMIEKKISAMQTLGVPYAAGYEKIALADMKMQANKIVEGLMVDDDVKKMINTEGITKLENKEIIALIAYLQRMGTDIKKTEKK